MKNVLSDIIKQANEYFINQFHFARPGIIIKFDPATKLAEVQPSIKIKTLDDQVIDMPNIVNVPVVFSQSKNFSDTFPLENGDGVLLVFSERSLEQWLDNGHNAEPGVRRKFDISDAIAIPGLFAKDADLNYDAENVIRKFNDVTFKMQPDGKFEFGNDSQSLLAILDEFMKFMRDTAKYGGSNMDSGTPTGLTVIIAKLDQIRGSL